MKELFNLIKKYQNEVVLLVGVILVSLLSFSVGYITAKQQKDYLRFENANESRESGNNWRWDMRIIS